MRVFGDQAGEIVGKINGLAIDNLTGLTTLDVDAYSRDKIEITPTIVVIGSDWPMEGIVGTLAQVICIETETPSGTPIMWQTVSAAGAGTFTTQVKGTRIMDVREAVQSLREF